MISSLSGSGGYDPTAKLREKMFERLDANSDGSIDKSELTDALGNNGVSTDQASQIADQFFQDFDGNGDGSVTQDEAKSGFQKIAAESKSVLLQAQEDQRAQDLFAKLDTDGDGSVTEAEFAAGAPKKGEASGGEGPDSSELFAKLDANGDGSLDQSELEAGLKAHGPHGGRHGPPPPPPPEASSTDDTADATDLFAKIDTDGDGSVSESEFENGIKNLFKKAAAGSTDSSDATSSTTSTDATSSTSSSLDVETLRKQMLSFLLGIQENTATAAAA